MNRTTDIRSKKRKKQNEYNRLIEEPNQEFVNVERVLPKESLEYIFRGPETLEREIVDVVFGDVQPIELPEREKKLDDFGKAGYIFDNTNYFVFLPPSLSPSPSLSLSIEIKIYFHRTSVLDVSIFFFLLLIPFIPS